jgi:hypothetical protein
MNNISISNDTEKSLSVEINHERLKHFFYMLHGEPTTRTRSLKGAILVSKSDICILIDELTEQLKLAHVREWTITVGLGFKKDIIEKPYTEFSSNQWTDPEKTTEVIIKINFLYEDYDSGNPLKHSMYIRIAKDLKPGNLYQLLATSDPSKLDNIEELMCPVFCRTDHVNDKLSKDLLGVVENWHEGQKQPKLLTGTYEFIRKHRNNVARSIQYSLPVGMAFILCYAAFSIPYIIPENHHISAYVSLIIMSKIILAFFLNIGGNRANKAYKKLSSISDEDVIFDITKGDNKEFSEVINKNNELFSSARGIFLWTNSQAIICSIIAAIIFETLKP